MTCSCNTSSEQFFHFGFTVTFTTQVKKNSLVPLAGPLKLVSSRALHDLYGCHFISLLPSSGTNCLNLFH